jgi:hypothetical protein
MLFAVTVKQGAPDRSSYVLSLHTRGALVYVAKKCFKQDIIRAGDDVFVG